MKTSTGLLVLVVAMIAASSSTASTDMVTIDGLSVTALTPDDSAAANVAEDTSCDDPEQGVCHADPDWDTAPIADAGGPTVQASPPPQKEPLCCLADNECLLEIGTCPAGTVSIECEDCPVVGSTR